MKDKVQKIILEYTKISNDLSSEDIIHNQKKIKELSIKQKSLSQKHDLAQQYLAKENEINEANDLLKQESDEEMKQYLKSVVTQATKALSSIANLIKEADAIIDSDDHRNAIVEIRAGTGGEESSLFAKVLYRMYLRYAESKGWKCTQLSSNKSSTGGFKEVIFLLSGTNVYRDIKLESGVHRVQRVPSTESSGRIHTSAVSVVVLPQVEDLEISINPEEIKIDVFRAGGPGGQSVNTTDSAVRITHIPTNTVVSCQDEKSQLKNKARALSVLKSRLYDLEQRKKSEKESKTRKASIRGGDRSVKIRTYNYPQSRITDHRIKKSWHNLNDILNGDLDEVLQTVLSELSKQK